MYNSHSVTGQLVLNCIRDSQCDIETCDSCTCLHHTPVEIAGVYVYTFVMVLDMFNNC